MHNSPPYKKIPIQNLPRRQQPQTTTPTEQQKFTYMNQFFQWDNRKYQCFMDTGISKQRLLPENGLFRVNCFFNAFHLAYINHGDVVLVPDQVWIMVLFYLSNYIDQHAEKLRKKLVSHEGVKTLTIVEMAGSPEQSLVKEKNWDYFFDQIIKKIKEETVQGVVQSLACDFSTTTKIYKTISTAIIMNSLKKFFQYHKMLAGCGINNVYMAGKRQDWSKMIEKLQNMTKFDVDGKLKTYIKHMKVILKNFLLTFDEKPDVMWWNTIMTTYQKRQQYGGDQIDIQGWILHFYGKYQKTTFNGFPQFTIKVPIKLTNTLTKKQKSLLLVSDWISISKLDKYTYKPDVGMCILTIKQGQIKQDIVQRQIDKYKQRLKLNQQFMKMNNISVVLPLLNPQTPKKSQKQRGKTLPKKLTSKNNIKGLKNAIIGLI